MKVKAIFAGYYGGIYRRPGDIFELVRREGFGGNDKARKKIVITPEQQFSERWMEKIEAGKASEPAKQKNSPAPAAPSTPTGDQEVI